MPASVFKWANHAIENYKRLNALRHDRKTLKAALATVPESPYKEMMKADIERLNEAIKKIAGLTDYCFGILTEDKDADIGSATTSLATIQQKYPNLTKDLKTVTEVLATGESIAQSAHGHRRSASMVSASQVPGTSNILHSTTGPTPQQVPNNSSQANMIGRSITQSAGYTMSYGPPQGGNINAPVAPVQHQAAPTHTTQQASSIPGYKTAPGQSPGLPLHVIHETPFTGHAIVGPSHESTGYLQHPAAPPVAAGFTGASHTNAYAGSPQPVYPAQPGMGVGMSEDARLKRAQRAERYPNNLLNRLPKPLTTGQGATQRSSAQGVAQRSGYSSVNEQGFMGLSSRPRHPDAPRAVLDSTPADAPHAGESIPVADGRTATPQAYGHKLRPSVHETFGVKRPKDRDE